MQQPALGPLEAILRACASQAPNPWYPAQYAREQGILRDELDPFLDHLRLGGLIQLTEWVKGVGQGYRLTPQGELVLGSPRQLRQLLDGTLRLQPEEPMAELPETREDPWSEGDRAREAVYEQRGRPNATLALIAINLLVFFGGMTVAERRGVRAADYCFDGWQAVDIKIKIAEVQHDLGSLHATDILNGQWYRLVSYAYLHQGLFHLGMNMLMLFMLGPQVERIWGWPRYLILYHLSALGGGFAIILASPKHSVVGASGAIWGIFCSLIIWLFMNRRHLAPPLVTDWMRRLMSLLFLNALLSFLPGISAAGHFGGGFTGAVVAGLLQEQRSGKGVVRLLATILLICLPGVGFIAVRNASRLNSEWDRLELEQLVARSQPLDRNDDELWRKNLEPLWKQPAKSREAATVQKALLDYEEICKNRAKILAIFEEAGPYRQPEAEKDRQGIVENIRQKARRQDRQVFRELLAPFCVDVLGDALRLDQNRLAAMLAQKPSDRDADRVIAARNEIDKLVPQLRQSADALTKIEFEATPEASKIREKLQEHLRAEADLLESSEMALKRGEQWTAADEERLQELAKKASTLRAWRP